MSIRKRDMNSLKGRSLNLARGMMPIRTGNMAFNATKPHNIRNGFAITLHGGKAYYAQFLQEGKGWNNIHEGFWDNIALAIILEVNEYLNEGSQKNKSRNMYLARNLRKIEKETSDYGSTGWNNQQFRKKTLLRSLIRSKQEIEEDRK